MSTKNQQQKLNNFWADDRLCLRRRPHPAENGRIHRNRKANIGPDILEMKVDKFIDGGEEIMAPLSMNRKKRWELLEAEEMPQKPERGIRVTKVIQRINPIGKSQMAGKDIFEEENVMEICSKGGNGNLIKKSCGSGRGVNKLAQLFQENDRPKKRRNQRKGRGLDESQLEIMDEGKPIWIELFGSSENEGGGQKKKAKKSGRNRAEEKEEEFEQKMHFYYTIKCQMATKHQFNSGWQQRGQNNVENDSMEKEKKYMQRTNLGRKCQHHLRKEMDPENYQFGDDLAYPPFPIHSSQFRHSTQSDPFDTFLPPKFRRSLQQKPIGLVIPESIPNGIKIMDYAQKCRQQWIENEVKRLGGKRRQFNKETRDELILLSINQITE